MTERQLQAAVLDLCKILKLWVFHPWTSIHSASGYPDLTIVGANSYENSGHPNLLFVELKSEKGKVSKAQCGWLTALEQAGAEVCVWRPADWTSTGSSMSVIETRLKELAR